MLVLPARDGSEVHIRKTGRQVLCRKESDKKIPPVTLPRKLQIRRFSSILGAKRQVWIEHCSNRRLELGLIPAMTVSTKAENASFVGPGKPDRRVQDYAFLQPQFSGAYIDIGSLIGLCADSVQHRTAAVNLELRPQRNLGQPGRPVNSIAEQSQLRAYDFLFEFVASAEAKPPSGRASAEHLMSERQLNPVENAQSSPSCPKIVVAGPDFRPVRGRTHSIRTAVTSDYCPWNKATAGLTLYLAYSAGPKQPRAISPIRRNRRAYSCGRRCRQNEA